MQAFSVDIIRHKDSIDELIGTQAEILGTCGDEQKAVLQVSAKLQFHLLLNSKEYSLLGL